MNFNLFYISPELILALGGMIVLAVGLGARKKTWPIAETASLVVLAAALVPTIMLLAKSLPNASQFGGVMAVDGLAVFFKIIAILSTAIVVFLGMDYFRGINIHRGEFYALLVFATLAITCLAASTDLIMIYLSLEFLSITSYILVGYLKQDPKSNEAAMKYFLYGSIAGAVMIYGMSMLYGLTGSTNILEIRVMLTRDQLMGLQGSYPLLFLSTLMILVGFGFKIAMAPFHQWAPDTYEGAPTPITAFLSVGSKAAGFAVLIRVLGTSITPYVLNWVPLIVILSGVTMTVGNLIAIPQMNIKRMLAYSSIAQAGYLLLGVAAIPYSELAIPAMLLYIFVYLFMNLGAFAVVTILSARLNTDDIRSYSGLYKRAPVAAAAMALFLLSLAGIPPTAGFLGKFYLFAAAIQSGNTLIFWLAIVAIINTVISVYYYMNVVRYMFFAEPKGTIALQPTKPLSFAVILTLAMTLIVLLYPQPFIQMAHRSATMLTGM